MFTSIKLSSRQLHIIDIELNAVDTALVFFRLPTLKNKLT